MLLRLFFARRFWPHFWAQFLSAFNDNVFKNGVIILITYRSMSYLGFEANQLAAIASGVSILPFFFLCAFSGEIADKWPKNRLVFLIKGGELLTVCLAVIGLLADSMALLLLTALLMGAQSTLFGPVKYSILADLVPEKLAESNALIGMGTFLAILLGTVLGGFLGAQDWQGMVGICVVLLFVGVMGVLFAWCSPHTPAKAPQLKLQGGVVSPLISILKITARVRSIQLAIWGISWFWFMGATIMSMLPIYVKENLQQRQSAVTLLLSIFSIGVAVGTLLGGRLARRMNTVLPGAMLLMGLAALDLWLAGGNGGPIPWRTKLDLFVLALAGGCYVVPLQTFIQQKGPSELRSRVIAGNNFYNALAMLASAVMLVGLYALGGTPLEAFLLLGVGGLAGGIFFSVKQASFK